jgi:hypothetical protein
VRLLTWLVGVLVCWCVRRLRAGRLCTNALLYTSLEPSIDPRAYIECSAQPDVVGKKNVTLASGFYQVLFETRVSKLSSTCVPGYFGASGELCEPCYDGAKCLGGAMEPLSLPGFFIGNLSLETRSDPCRHKTRVRCLAPRACDPPESCIGEDQCSAPYINVAPVYRCATCADGYYRLAGKCRVCPNNPWVLVVAFIVIVLAVAVVGYVLNRKSVNIAFLSIGIDYFQVLAMFSRSNVKWPERMWQGRGGGMDGWMSLHLPRILVAPPSRVAFLPPLPHHVPFTLLFRSAVSYGGVLNWSVPARVRPLACELQS